MKKTNGKLKAKKRKSYTEESKTTSAILEKQLVD